MKIFAGSDHAGFNLKSQLIAHLRAQGHDVADLGTDSEQSTDYPDHAARVARAVRDQPDGMGLLVCASGVGVSIAANKVRGIRAVDAWDTEVARLARSHNDANVLCLGQRFVDGATATGIVDTFLTTTFEGGRHARRIAKLSAIEDDEQD